MLDFKESGIFKALIVLFKQIFWIKGIITYFEIKIRLKLQNQ